MSPRHRRAASAGAAAFGLVGAAGAGPGGGGRGAEGADREAAARSTTSASGSAYRVNGAASVVCGNVRTANATVHTIDTVLMPK